MTEGGNVSDSASLSSFVAFFSMDPSPGSVQWSKEWFVDAAKSPDAYRQIPPLPDSESAFSTNDNP